MGCPKRCKTSTRAHDCLGRSIQLREATPTLTFQQRLQWWCCWTKNVVQESSVGLLQLCLDFWSSAATKTDRLESMPNCQQYIHPSSELCVACGSKSTYCQCLTCHRAGCPAQLWYHHSWMCCCWGKAPPENIVNEAVHWRTQSILLMRHWSCNSNPRSLTMSSLPRILQSQFPLHHWRKYEWYPQQCLHHLNSTHQYMSTHSSPAPQTWNFSSNSQIVTSPQR